MMLGSSLPPSVVSLIKDEWRGAYIKGWQGGVKALADALVEVYEATGQHEMAAAIRNKADALSDGIVGALKGSV